MNYAPSYIAAIVAVIVNLQPLLGLNFTSEMWTAAITVTLGAVIAIRQLATGRSTLRGKRPENFVD